MSNVAFVSGSSRGIGRAVALELARKGFSVAVNGRKASPALDGIVAEIAVRGGKSVAVPGGCHQPGSGRGNAGPGRAETGAAAGLVANAGAGPIRRADILEVTPAALHCSQHHRPVLPSTRTCAPACGSRRPADGNTLDHAYQFSKRGGSLTQQGGLLRVQGRGRDDS